MQKSYLVVGLGNPQAELSFTYHNIGKEIVARLAEKLKKKFVAERNLEAEILQTKIGKKKVILAIPLVSMNLSGEAVRKIVKAFKIWPEDIIIVHDDHDIEWGRVKVVKNRGSGGHKGVESVIKSLGTKNFIRIRVGTKQGKEKAGEIVLKKMPRSPKTEKIIEEGANIIEKLMEKGLSWVMSEYNQNKKALWER